MSTVTQITKHEFVQHTTKYLGLCEKEGGLVITHHNQPRLFLTSIKTKSLADLKGLLDDIKIHGDINEHVLSEYDAWSS